MIVLYPVVKPAWVVGNIEADSNLIAADVGPSHVKQPGVNVIAVKVFDNQAVGGIWKPVKLMAGK